MVQDAAPGSIIRRNRGVSAAVKLRAASILPVGNLDLEQPLPLLAEMAHNRAVSTFVRVKEIRPPRQLSMPGQAKSGRAFQAAHVHFWQIRHREIFQPNPEWVH